MNFSRPKKEVFLTCPLHCKIQNFIAISYLCVSLCPFSQVFSFESLRTLAERKHFWTANLKFQHWLDCWTLDLWPGFSHIEGFCQNQSEFLFRRMDQGNRALLPGPTKPPQWNFFQSRSILNLENLGFLVRFPSLPRKDRTKYLWLVSFGLNSLLCLFIFACF